MKSHRKYLMEDDQEAVRLDRKTDGATVEKQALWAGIKPGMRVADLGCGAGKTTFHLNKLIQPGGRAVGIDIAEQRIDYARKHYSDENIEYLAADIRKPLDDLGQFDFIYVRFVLEYYLNGSFDIVKNITQNLKPGGILCLIDLDCNCLRHFGFPDRLNRATIGVMDWLEKRSNFDPYVGIKLYSFLYDLGYSEIDVSMSAHNMFFGQLKENEKLFSMQKAEIGGRNSGYPFEEYGGNFDEFLEEVKIFFNDERVFYYTPLIACRGCRPE
ncbi:MAG: class I SAM-dependent methyltransferase [Deltaproteobacteria bacterium]|jgi:SAM-dependent methyltransferase|nr:class I SAM-dependent methyltransferase [Deltaproteobacteria bacterium]